MDSEFYCTHCRSWVERSACGTGECSCRDDEYYDDCDERLMEVSDD